MLYKIDKNGFIVNEANPKKVQPYYRKILVEISKLYNEKLSDNYHALSVLNYTHAKKLMLFILTRRITQAIEILFSTTAMLIKRMPTVTLNGLRSWRKDQNCCSNQSGE